jgi:hypothetical protein
MGIQACTKGDSGVRNVIVGIEQVIKVENGNKMNKPLPNEKKTV